ncbi:MAG: SPFH domain-containing protein [Phycisphaerales bacterium]
MNPASAQALVNGAGRARRPASVELRSESAGDADEASLDPATRSLADALRITYRLVQVAMVGLVGLFALSGFQSVQEGEEGIRLTMGEVTGDRLQPGFQMSFPAPFGELIRVQTSPASVTMKREFWPNLPEADLEKAPADLKNSARDRVDPAIDGSIMTADGNIGHAKVSLTYRRRDAQRYARNVHPADEPAIVRAAVMRGVVNAGSALSIDELLKDGPDEARPGRFMGLKTRAQAVAQGTLDALDSGIEIIELNIIAKTPPLNTIATFEKVQSAQSESKQATEKAEQERSTLLNATAGEAAPVLLNLIDRLDEALSRNDAAKGETILAAIDEVMDGKAATLDGKALPVGVSGNVATRLSAARQFRSSVVSRAVADAAVFEAKLAAFRTNAPVVLAGDWTEAYGKFLKRDNVEFTWLPPGVQVTELLINSDPALRRDLERRRTREAAEKQAAKDMKAMEDQKFKDKGIPNTVSE